ncbi:hypothetical protein BH11PSE11_BH11PSE11_32250 [soil metagenome]
MKFALMHPIRSARQFGLGLWMALLCMLTPMAANSASFTVNTTTAPLTGLWWNADESGWGMSLTQQGPIVFAAWYAYSQAGAPVWYVMSSCPIVGAGCTGDVYSVAGGTQLTSTWNGAGKVVTKVGTATLAFTDNNTGSFSYTLNGVAGSRSISRQPIASGTTAPAVDYSALWWNETESGWGVALTQQFNVIFVTLYTYDASGNPVWYVASNCTVSGNGCTGALYKVSGGTPPNVAWNGANKAVTQVGTVSFSFANASSGTMSYSINGATGSRAITKQIFYTAPSTGTGDSSVCVPTAFAANGVTYQQKYRTSVNGSNTQESTANFTTTTGVAFQGNSTIESRVDTTVTSGAGAGSTNVARNYHNLTSTQQIVYGSVNQSSVQGFTLNSTSVYTPSLAYPLAQNVGDVTSHTYTITTTTSGLPVTIPGTQTSQSVSRKFLGIERVTVAAGNFNACKFEDTITDAETTVSTNWFYAGGAGAGAFLKQSSVAGSQTTMTELVSGTIPGGAALPAN